MAAHDIGNDYASACSFCGRSRQQVDTLILGPGVAICDHCVRLCAEIVLERSYVTCFYCGTRAYQTDSFHVDAVHGICNACASALGRQPDRATDPLRTGILSGPECVCSFCEKNHRDARHLIAGPEVNICDECVHSCVARIAGSSPPPVNIE